MTKFYIADLHLGHRGIVRFTHGDPPKPVRPWDSVDQMNEDMIAAWNSTVHPKDKVYVLGDAVINRSALPLIGRLQGHKVLVGGNHDTLRASEYAQYFVDQKGAISFDKPNWLLTHIPVHTSQLNRWAANVHGHLHTNTIDHPGYLCVSAEQIGYKPISHEDLVARWRTQLQAEIEQVFTQE